MKHIFAIAFVALTACSTCCAPNAQTQLATIKADYSMDLHDQTIYCNLHVSCDAIRTAGYNASASLLTAESEPSSSALARARADVDAFTQALRHE